MDPGDIRLYIDDRPEDGVFRVHPAVFASEELFELEQKFIFGRTWNFLALESQFPKPNDFVSTWVAKTPVLVTRDSKNKVHAFLNACRHKGASVTRTERGNSRYHVCPYHGWAYDATGKNVDIKDRKAGCYSENFEKDSHDLVPLAKVASYKGLVFGSLSPDVPSLDEFLGDMKFFIDLAMDQGPNGMEFVSGRAVYTYDANWKLQMDNGIDLYHVTSTHASFMDIQARRRAGQGHQEGRAFDWQKRYSQEGGIFQLKNGHIAMWMNQAEPQKRPIYAVIDEIRSRVGDLRAEWMFKMRHTVIFPNLQIADSHSPLLRTFRPLAANRTEMRVHSLAPIGEPTEVRAARLRQFEDFFNPAGCATPDDTVIYADCQKGMSATGMPMLQGYSRGIAARVAGGNAYSDEIGIKPVGSVIGQYDLQSELGFHPVYREWARVMQAGIEGRKAYD